MSGHGGQRGGWDGEECAAFISAGWVLKARAEFVSHAYFVRSGFPSPREATPNAVNEARSAPWPLYGSSAWSSSGRGEIWAAWWMSFSCLCQQLKFEVHSMQFYLVVKVSIRACPLHRELGTNSAGWSICLVVVYWTVSNSSLSIF